MVYLRLIFNYSARHLTHTKISNEYVIKKRWLMGLEVIYQIIYFKNYLIQKLLLYGIFWPRPGLKLLRQAHGSWNLSLKSITRKGCVTRQWGMTLLPCSFSLIGLLLNNKWMYGMIMIIAFTMVRLLNGTKVIKTNGSEGKNKRRAFICCLASWLCERFVHVRRWKEVVEVTNRLKITTCP